MNASSLTPVETKHDKRARLRDMLAMFIHESARSDGDRIWQQLSEVEKDGYRADARFVQRFSNHTIRKVAEEMAAQAFAKAHGWDWPSLYGYPVDEGKNRELALLEVRQKIRHVAREMCWAFTFHLRDGNPLDRMQFEDDAANTLERQRMMDAERRQELHPASRLPALRMVQVGKFEVDPRD